jgi:hypothetical protein
MLNVIINNKYFPLQKFTYVNKYYQIGDQLFSLESYLFNTTLDNMTTLI